MTVYLVGAGPGDPGLLTVRGAEVLARADVVVHDRLSVASLLELAPPAAERISVGKTPRGPSTPQDEINALLVDRGRAGLEVVRLKGGDPFVFARGAEEAAALAAAGVAFEVVPGVTSAVAVPAYGGVPLTARGLATSFTVVTGHGDGLGATATDWEAVAGVGGTIVVLMGVATRGEIADRLLAGGLAASTPVAAVRWGTRPEQHTVRTTLGGLAEADLESPAVIVIGEVAGLDLAWYERLPLFGRSVVVTRPRHQAGALVERLQRMGAGTVELPTIEIVDPADGGAALRAAAAVVGSYDWVTFTSANAVARFLPLLRDARAFGAAKVAAIGPGTAQALAEARVVADLVPERFVGEGLLKAFPPPHPGGRVLLPRAAVARDILPEGLRGAGWEVDVVEAYRTRPTRPAPEALAAAGAADAVTFTSSSSVAGYLEVAGLAAVPPVVASIGPVTSATARNLGLTVAAEADVHTLDGLVDALVRALPPR
ncbi:MAG: uroporphyrinogen-III C-methyltransferase [Actinobacteria bacterium]|nr:uroporphyrinogen-III C-methyltransferase [Actinomycetota bacterium]